MITYKMQDGRHYQFGLHVNKMKITFTRSVTRKTF